MEIKSLGQTDVETIFKAFSQAFADYDVQVNREQLRAMWKRRGFSPDLSFAAFEGKEMVSFTLNGVGYFDGISTAYDTGTGTLKEHRGKGLATGIFEYAVPHLQAANIEQYLLEVLQHNTKAVAVYRKLGFEATREFNYFVWKNEELHNEVKEMDERFSVDRIEVEKYPFITDFWDFYPSWQNSFESIKRAKGDFMGWGVFFEKRLVGYVVFEPDSGDVTQIAVDKAHRRKGIASLLLREAGKFNRIATTKLLNTDVSCTSIVDFLKAKNVGISGKQFEMIKKI
ncbi:MAG: GNAT family N-acetyltransferase [Culturomica sp.]|jgi:ribosomal protein S18 acetylase RimI-like enzyme|nr:GNAT family N-acetyltransferase [Culturomica sp.]